tara:strand:+ start:2780 stop:3280 length:501 start_codon:yes stop_codon:yes gene_type:complete
MDKDGENKNGKIIQFPTNKIVRVNTTPLTEHQKVQNRLNEQIKKVQTKQYIEHQVDDIVMNLINSFLDMAIKTDKITFTKDLAMVVDAMRGLIYRDFGMRHTSHSLIDKIVDVKTMKNGHRSAVIDYGRVVEKTKTTKPFNKELKTELDDLSKGSGMFEPDDDLDK